MHARARSSKRAFRRDSAAFHRKDGIVVGALRWNGNGFSKGASTEVLPDAKDHGMTALPTPAEVAARLRCSRKTLDAHVRAGDIRYIIIGHGKKRPRRMFTDADVNEFLDRQARRDVPVEPARRVTRHSTAAHSGEEPIGLRARGCLPTWWCPKRFELPTF